MPAPIFTMLASIFPTIFSITTILTTGVEWRHVSIQLLLVFRDTHLCVNIYVFMLLLSLLHSLYI